MDKLVTQQNEAAVLLQTIIANYKKAPVERRTADMHGKKLVEFNEAWSTFEEGDDAIRQQFGTNTDHRYFTEDFYNAVQRKYTAAKDELTNLMQDSRSSGSTGQSNPQKQQAIASKLSSSGSTADHTSTIQKQKLIIETVRKLIRQVLEVTDRSPQFYSMKLKTIEQHWHHVSNLHEQLCSTAFDAYDYEGYINIESEINDAMLEIQERATQVNSPVSTERADLNCRLPRVELPKFDGNYLDWRQFYDLFVELVHNKPIPECQKFLYLKTSLSGEAEGLIQHFATTAANYENAWKTLKDRYENKRVIVNTLLSKLLSQPMHPQESIASLKSIHDTTRECLHSLQSLGIPIDNWDPILVHLLVQRLSKQTHILWEQSIPDSRELPSLEDVLTFIKVRFQSLEALGSKTNKGIAQGHVHVKALGVSIQNKGNCCVCKDMHQLYACPTFLKWAPRDRLNAVQKAKRCVNCLKPGHMAKECKSSTCSQCRKKHNSLLHLEPIKRPQDKEQSTQSLQEQPKALTTVGSQPVQVLLSTVQLFIDDLRNNKVSCRALLDSGSQVNIITKQLVRKLKLPTHSKSLDIEGIGQAKNRITERVNIAISSKRTGFSTRIEAYVLPTIVSEQPTQTLCTDHWNIPANISLSDETFNNPGRVDLLIGTGLFYSLLSVGQISLGDGLPLLQNTVFGWIVGGGVENEQSSSAYCGVGIQNDPLDTQLEKFWQLEECDTEQSKFTAAELRCEEHFLTNISRESDGRFVVRLPLRGELTQLGDSRDIALQRFKSVERRLAREPQLRTMYIKFMREYEELNHMTEVSPNNINGPHYFLPHHAVLKPDSTTTKLRVVFDASAKTSKHVSLNDVLATGPTIQPDVFTILLRFRLPRFVFSADVEKMYRQIWVNAKDRNLQLIWWREDPLLPLRCMQLNTVTYGTSSAPYLAIRTLQHLGTIGKTQYPLATEAIHNNFYVDDVLTGSDSMIMALEMQKQLRQLLHSAGLNLRKWCANDPRLLSNIGPKDQELSWEICSDSDHIKAMGMTWHPKKDVFAVKINQVPLKRVTKRTALADISRLFDPLGLMAPVVVTAKIFLQTLWKLKLDWDAALPQQLDTTWLEFSNSLKQLEKIEFPRHIFNHCSPRNIQLHLFADASEKAYGAAAYIRITDEQKVITVRLLCSKSRVAPVKQITLPRLELCAAKLATDLVARLHEDKMFLECETFYWSDSTAVLGWVRATSANYHTFVANRISAIQQISKPQQWHHVRSEQNPADLLSRGLMPSQLPGNQFWFYGPFFLHGPISAWPLQPPQAACEIEIRNKTLVTAKATIATDETNIFGNINHKNSLRKLQRIVAYVCRFINAVRFKKREKNRLVSAIEFHNALLALVKVSQLVNFSDDIKALQKFKSVENNSTLRSLCPFLDNQGILRVGGRLEESLLSFDAKHPMLLAYHAKLTKLIFSALHKEHLHVGAQTLLAIVRQRFWPLKGKNIARAIIQECVQCTRAKPQLLEQLMGSLPKDRVQPGRPFIKSGVDFFGPVWIHFKIRGKRPVKAYVAVFCCFATKAVHLELVGDLTTEAFIGALRRFLARRGHCSTLYCDNATNFVGARNQLQELAISLYAQKAQEKIINECTIKGVQFEFIPPRAPHFGGLWEAAVKSSKKLLQSVLVSANLTHEELETVIVEAEGIMNSRPLTPLSSDPNDLNALTPGHFLIGEPLTSNIDHTASDKSLNLLARWKLVTQIKHEFWDRWSREYLHSLQHRYKWTKEVHDITPNMMVIIKEDNTPPLKWPLGRIVNTIKGKDGLIRVVDVKTQNNILRRPITRIAPLPVQLDGKESHTEIDKSQQLEKQKDQIDQKQREREGPETRSSKKPRLSLLSTLFVALLCLPSCSSATIEVEQFKNDPGMYFEKIGSASMIVNEWNIVAYVNMTQYWNWNDRIQGFPDALQILCNLSKITACSSTSSLLSHKLDELKMGNQLLLHHQGTRTRRGAINIVGNIANALFGVLDQTYARQTAETIAEIEKNEESLNQQTQLQKSFLDNTIHIMKTSQEHIEKEFNVIGSRLNDTAIQMSSMNEKLRQEVASSHFHSLAIQMTLLIMYLQGIQDTLLEAMTDTHHGKINLELLPLDQLSAELMKIKTSLPISLRSPDPSDILKVYQLLSIETRIVKNLAIFSIRVPLLATGEFELLKLTAVPWISHHSFKQIINKYNFLISNLHRDQYMPLRDDEMKDCFHLEDQRYVCHQKGPFLTQGSAIAACEFALLNHQKNNTSCLVSTIGAGPHWMQLQNPNWWIYSIDGESILNAVCEEELLKVKIVQSGLLKLQDECVIKQPFTTIYGYHRYNASTTLKTYMSDIKVDEFESIQELQEKGQNLSYKALYRSQTEELELLHKNLSALTSIIPKQFNHHDIHHYTLGYITLLFILISIVVLILKRKNKHQSSRNAATLSPQVVEPSCSTDQDSTVITIS